MTYSELDPFLKTAHIAADAARHISKKWFRSNFNIDIKKDGSPVTIADKEIEQVIKDIIQQNHPEHHWFGEESGWQPTSVQPASQWTWVVDPIDGTKSFAAGMPSFGTLIALCQQQQPVLGIIDQPILEERWVGVVEQPSTFNQHLCQTRSLNNITQATLYSTTPDMFDASNKQAYQALVNKCKYRIFGGDCYSYGLLALGHVDMICEADMKPYDFLALVPIVRGAGGCISDWQGNPLTLQSQGEVLASANPSLHQQAIDILNNVAD